MKKLEKIYNEIMEELYQNAEPKASFKGLIEEAERLDRRSEDGRLDIQFENYFINHDKMSDIVESELSKYKPSKLDKNSLRFHIYLGASPTSAKQDEK